MGSEVPVSGILQIAVLSAPSRSLSCFLAPMPANANIKLAIEAALRAANNGFQSMDGSDPLFDQAMTAAAASKHMGGTIIKAHKDGDGDAFWFVPVRSDVVTKSGASEHKIAIVQSGNDGNGTATKLPELLAGEWLVTHAVRAVLTC